MTEVIRNQYAPDIVSAPGETLLEILESRGMSQAEFADRTGRPTKTINEIVKGKAAITPETALQFEFVLGIPATFWNNREQQYRESIAIKKEAKRLETQADWLDVIPYTAMAQAGWVPRAQNKGEKLYHALKFFGVASPSSWLEVWRNQQLAFRQSKYFAVDQGAVAAWLRKGELEAQQIVCEEYDAPRFRRVLGAIRTLTRDLPSNFAEIVVNECKGAGVKVVFVPELPRTRVWGATRWVSPSYALIQLSLRYKLDDHLWFTFFHEAAHVLLHGKREIFLEVDEAERDERETQADEFARDWLIPPNAYKNFRRKGATSCAAISRFAFELGITAGIVVGRLQHDRLLPRTHCNHLKKSVGWA
ncbi:MAG: XRE family transcriptional regulator [Cyanobacteria bacterium 13_1_20CM_4_61_6]|nr:MAG: XRE family transcriptional regulator [Cyanobacteria bacterium 13_1_20CM_4_61_6]